MLVRTLPTKGKMVVFDLEYTAWDGSLANNWSRPGEHREIVQIGAVKLDATDGMVELDSFECLVMPKNNPILSDYFIELTGITQDRVDSHGVSFSEMLSLFEAFVMMSLWQFPMDPMATSLLKTAS